MANITDGTDSFLEFCEYLLAEAAFSRIINQIEKRKESKK